MLETGWKEIRRQKAPDWRSSDLEERPERSMNRARTPLWSAGRRGRKKNPTLSIGSLNKSSGNLARKAVSHSARRGAVKNKRVVWRVCC